MRSRFLASRFLELRRRCITVLFCALAMPAIMAANPPSQNQGTHSSTTLQGHLTVSPEKKPVLKTPTKEYALAATTTYVLHTLQDNRLAGREIRAEGSMKPDGSFQVDKFFTVHRG